MKILLPYVQWNTFDSDRTYHDRISIDGRCVAYVVSHNGSNIHNVWIKGLGLVEQFSSPDKAKSELNRRLIAGGYTLLDSEDEAMKYRILL